MTPPRILVVDDNPELLTLLSSAFEEAGYAVQTAQRGRAALDSARRERPDLAVVDVLLPDLMGFDVAEALKKLKIPFIFMSGVHKGGRAAANALTKYGAIGYFEKPFERKELIELVAKALPEAPQAAQPEWDLESGPAVEEAAEAVQLTGRIDLRGGDGHAAATLKGETLDVKPMQAAVRVQPPATEPPPAAFIPATTPISTPKLDLSASQPVAVPPPPPPEALLQEIPLQRGSVRRGDLRDNLPQLLAAFYAAKETGELGLQKGQVKKVVYFEAGMPVFALSNLVADRLGQFLVRAGKIDEETLKHAADEAASTKQRTGDVLILMGLLTEQDRLYYIGQQIKSVLYSLFAWEEGSYYLSFQARARKEMVKLDIHPANLIMRGTKKLYKPERLRRLLPATAKPIPSGDPLFNLSDVELQPWEAHLLTKCDGSRTVTELIALSQRPENEAWASLVALSSLRVLEVR